jgi:tetratricopeptide (TPR) repeat protein
MLRRAFWCRALPLLRRPPPSQPHRLSLCQVTPQPEELALASAVDTVTSPQTSFDQKQAVWNQLRMSGRLAETIATLERLAAGNPQDAQLRTALGEARLQKLRANLEVGGDKAEIPILGMQAERYFGQALALDPKNWEAQFAKAAAMSHWPAELNKLPEVILYHRQPRCLEAHPRVGAAGARGCGAVGSRARP